MTPRRAPVRCKIRQEEDGTLVLEPAVVISELEHRYLANAALQAQIEYARAHPDERVSRPRRRS